MATQTEHGTLTTWEIDPAHTHVEFAARHMMISTVKGRFSGVTGTFRIDEEDPARSSVEAEIDATTIDTRVADRDKHLRSADFLDVENHPNITFRSTRIEPKGDGEYRLTGQLAIRGVAREITLTLTENGRVKDPWGGERVAFTATGRLNRLDYGLKWNQVLESGGVVVSNEVKVTIEVEGVLQDA